MTECPTPPSAPAAPAIPLESAAHRLQSHLSVLRPGMVRRVSIGLDGDTLRPSIFLDVWPNKVTRAEQWLEIWGDRWDGWLVVVGGEGAERNVSENG